MPSSAYRDFYLWALSSENPHRQTFLEVNGITQLVKLTITLLDGLVDSQDWPQLAEASILMSTYQIYEIVSDNLAIGLGLRPKRHVAGARSNCCTPSTTR
jgi:hypothetical protein